MEKKYWVYLLSNKRNGAIYTGVTNNLYKRVYEHKKNMVKGFTKKYKIHNLVYYEEYENSEEAIAREKQLKKWMRSWKKNLIEKENPKWIDLYNDLNK